MKKIAIIGTGYVGLVTGACLAEMGNQVICLDIDKEKIESLRALNLPFFEPGLEELVVRAVEAERLFFTDQYNEAIPGTDLCFLALPTPSNEDGSCDLSYVLAAAEEIAANMDNYLLIVNKSTVPIGTAEKVTETLKKTLDERGVTIAFDVASNPEFLREGNAVADCLKPERILIGAKTTKAKELLKELYAPFCPQQDRIQITDIRSAEFAKYAANAMLATRISFMNNLATLAEKLGVNIDEVRIAMGADERIGNKYLNAGIGFGGSCLPKDIRALCAIGKKYGHPTPLFDSVLAINEEQRNFFYEKIARFFGSLSGKTLAIWGLSFKPNTDDMREAPALYLIQKFLEAGAHLRIYDPIALPKAKILLNRFDQVYFASDEYDAAENSDAIILATEWKQFQFADFEKIGASMNSKVFFDGRNQHSPDKMHKIGFIYFGIGQPDPIKELVCP